MIVYQYSLVVCFSGIILGALMGTCLGVIHHYTYLRDHIWEFHIRATVKRVWTKLKRKSVEIGSFIINYIKSQAQDYYYSHMESKPAQEDDSGVMSASTTAVTAPLQWLNIFSSTTSHDDTANDTYDVTTVKDEHIIKSSSLHPKQPPYQTPPGSPQMSHEDNDDSTNIDDIQSLLPKQTSTLKQRRKK